MVPAGHAVKPEAADASILDPSGTTTDEELPLVTIDPTLTLVHVDCCGSGCKYPDGHNSQTRTPCPVSFPNFPGVHGKQYALPSSVCPYPMSPVVVVEEEVAVVPEAVD